MIHSPVEVDLAAIFGRRVETHGASLRLDLGVNLGCTGEVVEPIVDKAQGDEGEKGPGPNEDGGCGSDDESGDQRAEGKGRQEEGGDYGNGEGGDRHGKDESGEKEEGKCGEEKEGEEEGLIHRSCQSSGGNG